MNSKNVKRTLPCLLTDSEKRDFGRKLADLEFGRDQIESEKKIATEGFKEQLAAAAHGIRSAVRILRDGHEYREVECYWGYHWSAMMKTLTREDTGEIVETAIIQPEERQMEIGIQ